MKDIEVLSCNAYPKCKGYRPEPVARQHQYHSLFRMLGMGWHGTWIITVCTSPTSLPSVYLTSLHMTRSLRPAKFAYCKRSETGGSTGLEQGQSAVTLLRDSLRMYHWSVKDQSLSPYLVSPLQLWRHSWCKVTADSFSSCVLLTKCISMK